MNGKIVMDRQLNDLGKLIVLIASSPIFGFVVLWAINTLFDSNIAYNFVNIIAAAVLVLIFT